VVSWTRDSRRVSGVFEGVHSEAIPVSTAEPARFQASSDQSLLVSFGDEITPAAHDRVRRLLLALESEHLPAVRNLHPAYCSLLIRFDALAATHDEIEAILRSHLARIDDLPLPEPREVEIPVCYGGEFGPDLAELAEMHGMTADQAVALHSSVEYTAYFLGFTPGFAYLGGLAEALATPRLATPRRTVQAGSVGIAGNQTGVYPFSTAGGWRLIGRTPTPLFRAGERDMSLLSIGDRVRFRPIPAWEFARRAGTCH
jgi:inhibitor of KinA